MKPRFEPDAAQALPADVPPEKKGAKRKHKPAFNARAERGRVVGVDLVAVTGLRAATVQVIIAEVGTDMSTCPTVRHVGAWLG